MVSTCSLVFATLRGPLEPSSPNNSSSDCFLIKSSEAWVSDSSLLSSAAIRNKNKKNCSIVKNITLSRVKLALVNGLLHNNNLPFSSCVNRLLSSFMSRNSLDKFSWREIGIHPLYWRRKSCIILCNDLEIQSINCVFLNRLNWYPKL